MLDIKEIRGNFEGVKARLAKRGKEFPLDKILAADEKRREIIFEVEAEKAKKNKVSEEIAQIKKAKGDASALIEEMQKLSDGIKENDDKVRELDEQILEMLYAIPNTPHESVPAGADDTNNEEKCKWGEPVKFPYEPKAHWDIGVDLGILDFETGAKVTGARFTFYKGLGARLERAIINYYLNTHTANGYTEIFPPFLANTESMKGTGQLPKFAEDMFRVEGTDYYLIPTAEVPITNMHRKEIIEADALPLKYCAYSACFRAEAGSAGRDTRGLIRQHQFNKVELVKFVNPENSYDELEKLTLDAQKVLEGLGLPYRVVTLCGGDLGFSSAKTYDIEVWMPSYNRYVEISSCSNFEDYQARRADIKYRPEPKAKAQLLHTLNGSGVAIGRTVAAILENYQQPDGSVLIPEALIPYMGGATVIKK